MQLFVALGQLEEALQHLTERQCRIVDTLSFRVQRGTILLQLERWEEAEDVFRDLLQRNTDNYDYHRGLQCSLLHISSMDNMSACDLPSSIQDLSVEDSDVLSAAYTALQQQFPRSNSCRRVALDCMLPQSPQFHDVLDAYLQRQVHKGVPSLGSDLSTFYRPTASSSQRRLVLSEILEQHVASLQASGKFHGSSSEDVEPPTSLFWCLFLLAHHHDRTGNYDKALELLNSCEQHTPTSLDVYQLMAKVYKHAGDVNAASHQMDNCRQLDLQDRYVNNKATKYLLRADRVAEAQNRIEMFARPDSGVSGPVSLYDMQVMWWEIELGRSYMRQKQWGKALKQFNSVMRHVDDIQAQQFDFHSYCIRKMTLRAYVDFLTMQDNIKGHKYYKQACEFSVQCYLQMHNNKNNGTATSSTESSSDATASDSSSNMTAAERKKAKAKAKRDAAKKRKAEQAAASTSTSSNNNNNNSSGSSKPHPVETDPEGVELAAKDPLGEAWKYSNIVATHSPQDPYAHLLVFEVAMLRGKDLLALRSLKRAFAIGCDGARDEIFNASVRFANKCINNRNSNDVLATVIDRELTTLFETESDVITSDMLVSMCRERAASAVSMSQRVVAGKSLAVLGAEHKAEALGLLVTLDETSTLSVCANVLELLSGGDCSVADNDAAASFTAACHERFPCATSFGGSIDVIPIVPDDEQQLSEGMSKLQVDESS